MSIFVDNSSTFSSNAGLQMKRSSLDKENGLEKCPNVVAVGVSNAKCKNIMHMLVSILKRMNQSLLLPAHHCSQHHFLPRIVLPIRTTMGIIVRSISQSKSMKPSLICRGPVLPGVLFLKTMPASLPSGTLSSRQHHLQSIASITGGANGFTLPATESRVTGVSTVVSLACALEGRVDES